MTAPLNSAPRIDFKTKTNSACTFGPFTLTDSSDAGIDFTGSTFKLQVKARNSNDEPTGSVLLTLTTGGGIAGDVSAGEFQPTFPTLAAGGLAVGAYIYDMLQLTGGVPVAVTLVGLIDVEEGIASA